ncbi:MAG: MFS transporter [Candidimonas sp.]|nr:MAG: MFS transporter [Candidimonas sp.]TAM27201.1 MAG: MFS transporter [Candidimonas sp.]TAM74856.1 MAG: MFS transporter [Candidimonas sp.]
MLVICFGVLFGFGITSIAGVLDILKDVFQLSVTGEQSLVAILVIACFFGAMLAGPVSQRWGRRIVILLAVAFALAGYGIILATPDYAWFIAARIVVGVSVGLSSMVIPMYAAEATPARRRGAVVALFQLAITAGILIAYSIALAFASSVSWRLILGSGALPAILGLLAIWLLPESPRWLASRGDMPAAEHAARRLGLLDEWREISAGATVGPETSGYTADQGRKKLRRGGFERGSTVAVLMLCSLLFVLQNLSGIDGILYYAPRIFQTLGFAPGVAALAATFGLGLVNFVATLAALAIVDRAGRRPLLISGSAVMVVGLAAVCAAAVFDWPWVGLAGLGVYIMAFAVSLGPLPYVLMSELFPSAIREQGIAAASAISWLFNALVAFTFLSIVQSIGLAATIGLFLLVCVLSLVICIVFLPETRLVSLEVIEANVLAGRPLRMLGGSPPAREAALGAGRGISGG